MFIKEPFIRKIYDISPLVSEKIAVFPGDTPFSLSTNLSFEQGHHLDLCQIQTTTHLGAHADAPRHYDPSGAGINEVKLTTYWGACQVIEVNLTSSSRIQPEDFKDVIQAPRILFKTNSFPDPNQWRDDFVALTPELIDFLAQKDVVLVGIDTPSIDLASAKDLIAHQAVAKNKMAILEGIILAHISPGQYELVALPLNLHQADSSPVRAVLREL